ncbi:MAG: hypothetical protein LBP55_10470 [Candidatus Adiutrix sp.]|jgi:flagellin-like hook-associated protein FlgL|nr:hypothetical protein [Candidatus Adiutrix sp.]
MSLVINNNMMAANTARILGNTYDRLSQSTQRLSSGLRINGAADDAAGLAIRELMRTEISAMQQGIRNAADGISLIQTAEGAMAVIDEKLTRMKELAEQAASGTYTTVQREIINSEYQAMAAEIDRIANSANFNGVKLLDGSMSAIHQGKGLKIHFGTGNNEAEDYYFIQLGDIRATSETGLRIAGDAKNDIWGTVGTHSGPNTNGCCGGGIPSLNDPVPGWHEGEVFAYGYNWDWQASNGRLSNNPGDYEDPILTRGRYIAGAYQADSTPTLQELMDMVNRGSQARVRVDFHMVMSASTGKLENATLGDLLDHPNPLFRADLVMLDSANTAAANVHYQYGPLDPATKGTDISDIDDLIQLLYDNGIGTLGKDPTPANIQKALDEGVIQINPKYNAKNTQPSSSVDGDQERIIKFDNDSPLGGAHRLCIGDEIYYIGSAGLGTQQNGGKFAYSLYDYAQDAIDKGVAGASEVYKMTAISAIAYAINNNVDSKFWARIEDYEYEDGVQSLYIFAKEGGDKHQVTACDEQLGDIRGADFQYDRITWYNDEVESGQSAGTYFNNGGMYWGTLKGVPTGYGSWGVQLHGQDVGDDRDLWILNVGPQVGADISTCATTAYTGLGFGQRDPDSNPNTDNNVAITNLLGLDRQSFVQIQEAADGKWDGAHVRTQSHAQEALDAINGAIERKDKVRATLGAYQNRLENTITNLETQAENLQASESRISDVDMATEMTNFVRNQVLTQAAISMLSQANSLPQMALSLLNG